MSGKDPFAEPGDTDKTVVRPNPGGRRPAAQPAAAPEPQSQAAPAEPAPAAFGVPEAASTQSAARRPDASEAAIASVDLAMTGMNRLNASEATLFALISRIRNRAQHMDPDALRKSVVSEIRAFENRALQAGIDAQQVKIARYGICATLDDVVLNTPWGGDSVWATQSMVGTFHRETVGGDRFFDLLARLEQDLRPRLVDAFLNPVQDLVGLRLGYRRRLVTRATDEAEHLRHFLHEVPGVIVHLHLHEHISRKELALTAALLPFLHLDHFLGRDENLTELVLQPHALDALFE